MPKLFFEFLALGNIPGGDHDPLDIRVIKQVVYGVFKIAPRAVFVRHPKLYRRMKPRSTQDLGEYTQGTFHVVWMNRVKSVRPQLILEPVTHRPLECSALIVHSAIGAHKREDV